jgi:hypothetical protein
MNFESRRIGRKILLITILIASVLAAGSRNLRSTLIRTPSLSDVRDKQASLPLSFEANWGQVDSAATFVARGLEYSVSLSASEAVVTVTGGPKPGRLRMQLRGANSSAQPGGENELLGKANYLIGNDREKWRTNVPTYGAVEYTAIYPGIDLRYHGNGGRLEYDFIAAAGADIGEIRMAFESPASASVHTSGDLVFQREGTETFRLHKPVAYQNLKGIRRDVAAEFLMLDGAEWGFKLGDYDGREPVVIDPVVSYATYFGGTDIPQDRFETGHAVATDAAGSTYLTGETSPRQYNDFPTMNPLQPSYGGNQSDAFITKLNPEGSALVFSTYFGGSGVDVGKAIHVDSAGNVFVAGNTTSANFPTVNAFQSSGGATPDAFVAKLTPSGAALFYSTYIGGSNTDTLEGMAVDNSGSAFLTGITLSSDFPTMNPIQTYRGNDDAFVTKLSATGSALVYSTYLGGGAGDEAWDIAVNSSGNAFVTGYTLSPDFPTTLFALQRELSGDGTSDAFVIRLNAAGSNFVFSTYFGGTGRDRGKAIAVDENSNTYITGWTDSADLPTVNALQPAIKGGQDAFVAKLNPTGSSLTFSTYLGGSGTDEGTGIALDGSNNIYVTGYGSSGFPLVHPNYIPGLFVTKFDASGSTLLFSSGGGSTEDFTVTDSGEIVLTGSGLGISPTPGAFHTALDIYAAVGLVKLSEPSGPPPTLTAISPSSSMQNSVTGITLTGTNFVAGSTSLLVTGSGVTVSAVSVSSPTSLSATFTISADAPAGVRSVFAVTTNGGGSNDVQFTVLDLPPTLTSMNITSGLQGTTVNATLAGTHFLAGETTVNVSGSGVTASMVNVTSQTSLAVKLTVDSSAPIGPRNISVTTPSGTSNSLTFTVKDAAGSPTITTLTPASAEPGSMVTVTIVGTGFISGNTTVAVDGADVSAGAANVTSSTSLNTLFTVSPSAALGPRSVSVTTANGMSNVQPFTVSDLKKVRSQVTSQ